MTENVNVLDIDLTQTNEELNQTSKSIKDLRAEIKEYRTTLEEATIGSSEFDKALGDLTQAQDQLKNATKQTATAVEGSYDAMVQSMSELKKQWRATADEMERKDLGNKIGQLNSQLKSMDASVGNFQRNVGNYQSALEGMSSTIGNTGDNLQGIINGFGSAALIMNSMGIESEELTKAMKTMQIAMMFTNALKSLTKGSELFTKMGVAIKGAASASKLFTTSETQATAATTAQTVATGAQTTATTTATIATKALTVAMYALPIVAIIGGLTALISSLAGFGKAADNTTSSTERYAKSLEKMHEQFEELDEDNANEIRIMKAKGASLDEIHDKEVEAIHTKKETINATLKEIQAEFALLKTKRARAKFEKDNKATVDKLMADWNELDKLEKSLNKKLDTDKQVEYWDKVRKGAAGAAKSHEEAAKALEAYIKLRDSNQVSRQKISDDLSISGLEGKEKAVAEINLIKDARESGLRDMYKAEKESLDKMLKAKQITQEQYNSRMQLLQERHNKAMQDSNALHQKELLNNEKEWNQKRLEEKENNKKFWIDALNKQYDQEMDLLDIHRKAMEVEYENQEDSVGLNALNQEFLRVQEEKLRALREEYIKAGADITEINMAIKDNLIEQQQLFYEEFDAKKEKLIEVVDAVKSSADSILSIGDGISSEWSNVFDSISAGIDKVSTSLRKSGKEWEKYGAIAVTAMDVASSVLTALVDEQDEKTKEGFEAQKKMQIAQVVMNTLAGVISAVTSAFSPSNAWMTIYGQSAAAAAMSAMITGLGIAQISKIQKTKFGDGTVESGNVNITPSVTAVGALQNGADSVYLTGGSIEQQVKDQRVYVVESDISNTMNRVQTVETEAIF